MKRRYVYMNIVLIITALLLPCPFLKFGQYTESRYMKRAANDENPIQNFDYIVPQFEELEKYMKDFAKNYSYFAQLYELGKTGGEDDDNSFPIYNMVLSSGYSKPIIVFIGGIFASDLASTEALIYCFTEWTTNRKTLAQLLPLFDYHFIPLVNPEGYEFVHRKWQKGVFFQWLKNMRGYSQGQAVNILNNFDSYFGAFSKEATDENFGGKKPFSETESVIIREYIMAMKNDIAAVFMLFSSKKEDAITYPYAHTMEKYDSWILHEQVAIQALRSDKDSSYGSFSVVSTAEYGGLQGGRMDDWLQDNLKKSVVLNVQLNFSLKATDNRATIKKLNRKVQKLLKGLVVSLDREKYPRSAGLRKGIHKFPWRKIVS